MRIAFFITVHKNPAQLARLLRAIYRPENVYLVHADRKSAPAFHRDVAEIILRYDNVDLMRSSTVNWGGFSQCRVTAAALRRMLVQHPDWQYFVNLSGQDFPIRPVSEFASYLAGNPGLNYIDVRSIDGLSGRLKTVVRRRSRWLCVEVAGRAVRLPIPTGAFTKASIEHYGSSWCTLDRSFCDWVVHSDEARSRFDALRYTHCPDESLFQTLIMSSPFAERICPDNNRFIIFDGKPNPVTLTTAHLDRIETSGAFFARKFDLEAHPQVLDDIERRSLAPVALRTIAEHETHDAAGGRAGRRAKR